RCDAHAAYPERFVSRLVEAMRAQRADSVVVPMDAMAESGCFQRGLAWIADSKLGAGGSAHRGGTASGFVDHGHHAAFRLAAFTALGGYDTGFRANEDAEYDRRLTDAGGRIWLDGGIRIGYFPRSTPGGLLKQYYHYGRGRAQTCLKHRIRPKLRQLIPVVNLVLLAASLALVPFTAMGLLWPLVYGALLAGAAVSSALRHGSPCALWGGPAIGIMHIAWGYGFLTRIGGIGRSGR
ncbi:MAG: glycosyltransferase family 2 protein, partial [Pseudomonadota bacterium]